MSNGEARKGMARWFSLSGRALTLLGLLFFLSAGDAAVAGTYQATVESGGLAIVNVLDKDNAPETAIIESVGRPAHGNAAITENKRGVSFQAAGEYIGSDTFTYQGKDPKSGQEYRGRLEVSIVTPQRIVGLDYGRVAGVLGIVLVLAIVLEIGLATVFNWKYFQDNLEGRGLRTPIAVVVSLFFTLFYGLDVVSDLLSAFTTKGASFEKTYPGYLITAFIIAGGSGTVNRLFAAFGLRSPVQEAQLVVNLTRGPNVGANTSVTVSIDNQKVSTETGNRLPAQGSYRLSPGPHTIKLDAVDNAGKPVTVQRNENLGPSANVTIPMTLG